jgi:CRISPR-associated endonuclease/helicase Cas3
MSSLAFADFDKFFRELHAPDPRNREESWPPYDWQSRLAEKAISGDWPDVIDLPTGSGKTACIDVAVFALACQAARPRTERTAPRRLFFCVNRRVIVDEAHQRSRRIAERLMLAEAGKLDAPTLVRVAQALRQLSTLRPEVAPPLDVLELRGGIYRDNRWARSVTQPTIVCTTIDQLGSRLLFRGYGVSPNAAPIQAALIAYDSLVFLDEAHISRPFLQTLGFVEQYLDPQRWAKEPLGARPMVLVPMTATPPKGVSQTDVLRLSKKDRESPGLDNRLRASKPARLLSVADVAEAAVVEAESLAMPGPTAVGVIVNRVATARRAYEQLRKRNADALVELVIGSMRPIDRDEQAKRLDEIVGAKRPPRSARTSLVVATQCLEVGADYDFDALVTECASLDALRQRFGRLNRAGREINAQAAIVIDNTQIQPEAQLDDEKPDDPIYGNALARTWNWLNERAEVIQTQPEANISTKRRRKTSEVSEVRRVDLGIDAFTATLKEHFPDGGVPVDLMAPSAKQDAPVMLPAYVDFWCQTNPKPTPDPEPALFIHGAESGEPDVQVCWRADLVEDESLTREDWCDVVALLPPTAAECMTVPISRLRSWLMTDDADTGDDNDLLSGQDATGGEQESKRSRDKRTKRLNESRVGVLWRGLRDTQLLTSLEQLRPGDTLVLPAACMGWSELGHVPNATIETIDVAERAFRLARDRVALRIHPSLPFPPSPALTDLYERATDADEPAKMPELSRLLKLAADALAGDNAELANTVSNLANPRLGLSRDVYPDDRGIVLTTRRRLEAQTASYVPAIDEGDDARSRTARDKAISLHEHTRHVKEEVSRTVQALSLDNLVPAVELAANLHDVGKADERFQAMLRRTDRTDAWLFVGTASALLAKSPDGMAQTLNERKQARQRAGVPEGFRHEMLSLQLAQFGELLLHDAAHSGLILHLIASHHGFGRPFAPVVADLEPPDVTANGFTLTAAARVEMPPHRVDSGIAERFWLLTRRYGWWGLAYLEAILRLADQQASADEDEGRFDSATPAGSS